MKLSCAVLTVVLLISAGVYGERCKVEHVKTSSLKCGDKVYSQRPETIAAFNECNTEGNDLKIGNILCVFEKLGGVSSSGEPNLKKLEEDYEIAFHEHAPALLRGALECLGALNSASDEPDEYGPIECLTKVFEDVCGYKSCDWMNNLKDVSEGSQRDEF